MTTSTAEYSVALKAPGGRVAQTWVPGTDTWQPNACVDDVIAGWLTPLFPATLGYLLHNDEDPVVRFEEPRSHSCGHVKGILFHTATTAVYLLHSCPRWPSVFPPEPIPESELIYGQSFILVTMPISQMQPLVDGLSLSDPNVYKTSNFPFFTGPEFGHGRLNKLLLQYEDAAAGRHSVTYVSKNRAWALDMYADGLAPLFNTRVLVESWRRPTNPVPDESVTDVFNVFWEGGVQYHSSQDHSKYCIGTDNSSLVYVGSMNHMTSQRKRGGDGFVIFDPHLQGAFNRIMKAKELVPHGTVKLHHPIEHSPEHPVEEQEDQGRRAGAKKLVSSLLCGFHAD